MTYRELSKRLRELGCVELVGGKGSHRKWYNPTNGTVRAVIRQLGIACEDFGRVT